jgi:hypothetical protein
MSNRAKGLLVTLVGVLIHMNLLNNAKFTLEVFKTSKTYTAYVLPLGRLNYEQVANLASIEMLILIILWIAFAVVLFRDKE